MAISIHAPRTGSDLKIAFRFYTTDDFNPRSPHGERPGSASAWAQTVRFQSTLPARGATLVVVRGQGSFGFQSTLPARGATQFGVKVISAMEFQSTLPARGATYRMILTGTPIQFQSTLPARGATWSFLICPSFAQFQSTLPARGATHFLKRSQERGGFQSTLPARGATGVMCNPSILRSFQSTLPARGATVEDGVLSQRPRDFNPRSPHGERRARLWAQASARSISIHAPRTGSDHTAQRLRRWTRRFQSTLPARGATLPMVVTAPQPANFNPRSPHGERLRISSPSTMRSSFQSTLPARGATRQSCVSATYNQNFNPRSPHGERPCRAKTPHRAQRFQSTLPARGATDLLMADVDVEEISIHAPRTGSDPPYCGRHRPRLISIHAPRTGSDMDMLPFVCGSNAFQSTLPARGATLQRRVPAVGGDISIHAPRTGSDKAVCNDSRGVLISIHAPRTGSDRCTLLHLPSCNNFNPRSPHGERPSSRTRRAPSWNFNPRSPHGERRCRRRTTPLPQYFNPRSPHGERRIAIGQIGAQGGISIHAPRTGSDTAQRLHRRVVGDISIHAPRTGSDLQASRSGVPKSAISIHAPRTGSDWYRDATRTDERRFQSTLPARGATFEAHDAAREADISIHAPRTGSDTTPGLSDAGKGRFQSTLPARGATDAENPADFVELISIHAPRTGSDPSHSGKAPCALDFNPRSPHGERRRVPRRFRRAAHFNPRSPHGERPCRCQSRFTLLLFQSTLPARGATHWAARAGCTPDDFNPRSPHGERPPGVRGSRETVPISIHAPRTGSDRERPKTATKKEISIHAPRTGSDLMAFDIETTRLISIHAPRTGSDASARRRASRRWNFNPRSPHGERPQSAPKISPRCPFQSTLPARGATSQDTSSHAPPLFQSTLPARGATAARRSGCMCRAISIHAPRTGSD